MSKDKWVAVYNGDGKHVATVNGRGEMRSLGKSNDKGARVRDEIRAAELQYADHDTRAEFEGYYAHYDGTDVPRGGWAGWLEREISTHDERLNAEVSYIVAAIAHSPPPDGWKDRVHEECDKIDEQRTLASGEALKKATAEMLAYQDDEQRRHDVAASVARHAEACEQTRKNEIMRPCVHEDAYGSLVNDDGLCMLCGALGIKTPSSLDGIDQSEPTPAPDEPLVEQQDIHDEPTHVGTIDDRFEDGDGL